MLVKGVVLVVMMVEVVESQPPNMMSQPPTMMSQPPTMMSLSPTMALPRPNMMSPSSTMTSPPPTMTSPPPTILYVESDHNAAGNSLLLLQRSFSHSDAYLTLPVASLCQCRSLCWSDRRCHGATLVSGQTPLDSQLCHLTSSHVDSLTLTENYLAKIYLPQDSLGYTYLGREGGAVYLCPAVERTFSQAKDYCTNLGFQLAIVKTEREFNVTMRVANGTKLIVDLVKDNGVVVWGDGTPFSDTFPAAHLNVVSQGSMKIYMIVPERNEVHTLHNTKAKRFLCQGLL